jgi:hypothetical protein
MMAITNQVIAGGLLQRNRLKINLYMDFPRELVPSKERKMRERHITEIKQDVTGSVEREELNLENICEKSNKGVCMRYLIVLLMMVSVSAEAQTVTCHAAQCPIAIAKIQSALHGLPFTNVISILDQDQWAMYKKAWHVSDRQTITFTNPSAHIIYLRLGYVLDANVNGSRDSLRYNLLHELGHMMHGASEIDADYFAESH